MKFNNVTSCSYVATHTHAYMYIIMYVQLYLGITHHVVICIYIYLMQKHLRCKKVRPSKVESYLEVNA